MIINKTRLTIILFASFMVCMILHQTNALAQDAKDIGGKKRVENRYPTLPKASDSPRDELDEKVQNVPLPEFVKESLLAPPASSVQAGKTLVPSVDSVAFDMGKSVQRSLDANPQMQSARALYAGSEQSRRQSLANFGPVGTVSYSYKRVDTQTYKTGSITDPSVQVINSMTGSNLSTTKATTPKIGHWQNSYQLQMEITQPLFTGFKLLSSYQKAELAKEQAEANVKYSELTLVKAVQQAFLALLQARSNVQSNMASVARLESQYKVAQAYYDVGLKPRLDVLQAESDLAQAEQDLLKAQNNVLVQTAQLNSLLNLPLNQQTNYVGELAYLPFPLSIEACLDTAYKQRPDLYMGVKSVQMAERDAKIATSPLYPQVQTQATYTKQGNTPNLSLKDMSGATTPDTTTIGVSATLQAWDWGSTFFGIQVARDNVKKLQADLAKLRLDVGYQVKTFYLNIQDAAKRISVARTALEASMEGYRMAVARYQAQVGTSTDVLDAQARVSSAEFNLTQALTDYQSALADIYVAMGMKDLNLMPL